MKGEKMSLFQKIRNKFRRDKSAYAAARELAHFFVTECGVQDVWLFGSTARTGVGNDVDMIVSTGDERDEAWLNAVEVHTLAFMYNVGYSAGQLKLTRMYMLCQQLLVDEHRVREITKNYDVLVTPDLFMFPHNWRQRRMELQRRLNARDPLFMRNIAREARRYNPRLGEFEQPKQVEGMAIR